MASCMGATEYALRSRHLPPATSGSDAFTRSRVGVGRAFLIHSRALAIKFSSLSQPVLGVFDDVILAVLYQSTLSQQHHLYAAAVPR
jgi:hypothetical protein